MRRYFPLNTEEMVVVHVAAYICRFLGFPKPPKRQVLNIVSARQLMRFYDDDQIRRRNGERKWENDLAYAREDLTRVGYMRYAETNEWELSETGITKLEQWAMGVTAAIAADPSERTRLLTLTKRVTPQLLDYLQRIANRESLARKPHEKGAGGQSLKT
jgi:hypothetical protein